MLNRRGNQSCSRSPYIPSYSLFITPCALLSLSKALGTVSGNGGVDNIQYGHRRRLEGVNVCKRSDESKNMHTMHELR